MTYRDIQFTQLSQTRSRNVFFWQNTLEKFLLDINVKTMQAIRSYMRRVLTQYFLHQNKNITFIICNPDPFSVICGEEALSLRKKYPSISVCSITKASYPEKSSWLEIVPRYEEIAHNADQRIRVTKATSMQRLTERMLNLCETCFAYSKNEGSLPNAWGTSVYNVYNNVQKEINKRSKQICQLKEELLSTSTEIQNRIVASDVEKPLGIYEHIGQLFNLNEMWENLIK